MFNALERQQRLTRNQKCLIFAGAFGLVLEFLDYFLIGFILTFVSKPWGLSFGQSSVILLSSGVGAMIGAAWFGRMADRVGRRKIFMATIIVFSLSMFALIFTPDNPQTGWLYLSFFRFLIGFGAGGLYCVDLPLIQEFVPSRKRGVVTGLVTCAVPLGFLIGSAMVAFLAPAIGWRGLMAVCVGLSSCVLLVRRWVPESPRWLMRQGRANEARDSIAWALEVKPTSLPLGEVQPAQPAGRVKDLLKHPRALAMSCISNLGMQTGYYGLTLWAPSLLVLILGVPPAHAAFYMIFITMAALAGRVTFSLLSEAMGRRAAGILCTAGAAVMLLIAAFFASSHEGAFFAFMAIMMLAFFFGEGGFAIVGPYSAEVWPTHLRTTGMGAAYGFGGIGKIIGPMGLAVIVGASTSASPASGQIAFDNAFIYFAAWYALACLAYVLWGIETRGRTIEAIDAGAR
ncbi:MFS transporter [Rhizobium leguminosarum]|uniref:MFS transporter n=1 Tax=Rhizobium leguminosarum TaxID=384 RepID=UPI003F973798